MSPKAKADDSPGSPTTNDHAAPGDKVESVNNAKVDNASLKRAREGSQEPTPSPNPTPLATKKNRLETTSEEASVPAPAPGSTGLVKEPSSTSESGAGGETGKVGEVRRKVQEMGWEEIKDEEVREAKAQAASAPADQAGQDNEGEGEGEAGGLKRKTLQRNESSVLGAGDEVPAKKARETPSPPPESKEKEDTVPPAAAPAPAPAPAAETKKPQATFGSFSKTASPFGAGAGRTASPFASASSSAAAASGSKPLSTGSAFGTYSSSFSAFSKKPPVVPQPPADPSSTSSSDPTAKSDAGPSASGSGSTFGDILSQSKADEGERGDKVQMTEKDVYTGEEDEETVYQCRAKLYVMQADGGWKERGVGALRLNVRASDQKGPRLVMRAEGVLRLILNISLYVGMACLEDGKHVRATVFEDNEKRFITFRLGTQKAASELCQNIRDHIPLESNTKSPRPDAPSPSPAV